MAAIASGSHRRVWQHDPTARAGPIGAGSRRRVAGLLAILSGVVSQPTHHLYGSQARAELGNSAEHTDEPLLQSRTASPEALPGDGAPGTGCAPLRESRFQRRQHLESSGVLVAAELWSPRSNHSARDGCRV